MLMEEDGIIETERKKKRQNEAFEASRAYLKTKDMRETKTTRRSRRLKPLLQKLPWCTMNP